MPYWVIWLIAAGLLGIAEMFTLTLALGLIAIAALVAGIVGAVGVGFAGQVVAFVIAAAAGLLVVRPIAKRHIKEPPVLRTGVAALVGRSAEVTEEVTGSSGRVRLAGEDWSARAYDETLVIPAGATVDVMEIDGATAVVYPREPLPS
ncbi:NfeD family protein [Allonocardiopsis opalescens]|uniref:Membrane protein implicated in regulation of membrane protease activity n=1 Tax=Allonocardiopsis opalescens TaxID=1144618 RepID=A0A2T0Q0B7_9ACTN|nr:NfeD family protein [Allonocardiopsis opalescens]PRX97242.1 membrane protein implicated in regulation of membrane protease activity [Allonocardiopsis opalescens]